MDNQQHDEKRMKFNDPLIKSILGDEFIELPQTRKYYAGKIQDRKLTSGVMRELNEKIPIDCMEIVKRVNLNLEVLICPIDNIQSTKAEPTNEAEILIDFLKFHLVSDEIINGITCEIKIVDIPVSMPLLRWQFDELRQSWPCKFHENKYQESLYSNSIFSQNEQQNHQKFMKICKFMSNELQKVNVGLAVNPYNHRIVAFGFNKSNSNPILHSSMDLVEQVAITQNGGAWSSEHSNDYLELAKKVSALFNVDFGEGPFELSPIGDDNLHKFGPYLCTGYSIYLLNEPCLMCSMALIHSRAKRVFYHKPTRPFGSLGTLTKLHTNKNLNHRFEVFQIMYLS